MDKKIWITFAVVALLGIAWAQSGPTGSSIGFLLTGGNCQTPVKGQAMLCGTTTGWQSSIDGGAYTTLGSTGPAGPQGPIGPAGPQGPAGTPASSMTCTTMTITATGVTLSGCK